MAFRRDGKAAHASAQEWQSWLDLHAELLRDSGIPSHVLRSRADWDYLLFYGYYGYPRIDFLLEDLSPNQRVGFQRLLETVLTPEERERGCAGWHFVCPPSQRAKDVPERSKRWTSSLYGCLP
jgi:hypothetical protein